jgi:hypothetical protein
VLARSRAMIRASMPSIRSMLFFFDGFQLSAASFSMLTLPAIQRSTGLPQTATLFRYFRRLFIGHRGQKDNGGRSQLDIPDAARARSNASPTTVGVLAANEFIG